MRKIDKIVIHFSWTYPSDDIGAKEIRDMHVNGNGWRDIGYHYVIRLDGTVELGRRLEQVGAHVRGHNRKSIGICYIGGKTGSGNNDYDDTRTEAQTTALRNLVLMLRQRFGNIKVVGHRDLAPRGCPGFDAKSEEWPSK